MDAGVYPVRKMVGRDADKAGYSGKQGLKQGKKDELAKERKMKKKQLDRKGKKNVRQHGEQKLLTKETEYVLNLCLTEIKNDWIMYMSGVNSTGERSPFDGSCCGSSYNNISTSEAEEEEVTEYRIVLLGDSGVGKTALVNQFMTSEYMNTYDASLVVGAGGKLPKRNKQLVKKTGTPFGKRKTFLSTIPSYFKLLLPALF
ncbi:hypothetical protein RUM44_002119 [Polyplax serrata]|uniref:Uncharacterized protein n=1 Tax=Polyplax serrata TaxID=468196 RepID=A0ABR1ANQ5_POLSC